MEAGKLVLRVLGEYTDRVFLVPGTDYASIIKAKAEDPSLPEFVTIPHEITSASSAMGYSLGGKLGVLMVHTVPGTLNAMGVVADAYVSRIPMVVVAGKSPLTEEGSTASKDLRIHWTQDADQESLVKYVKWSFEVRHPSQLVPSLHRAVQIALSEPQGPVYLALPRELTVQEVKPTKHRVAPFRPGPPREAVERAREMIERASNPVIITWRAGRRESWFRALRDFAHRSQIPVLNYVGERVNYPSSGEMALDRVDLKGVDLILAVEVEVPWIPKRGRVDAEVIKVDVDPSYSHIPYYGFPCDLCVQSSVDEFLDSLKVNRVAEKDVLEEVERQRAERKERVEKLSTARRIHPDYLSYEIGRLGWTVFNEYDMDPRYGGFDRFNSYVGDLSMGHLGWSMGASVGYKMATGEDVVTVVGDGSFIFGVPSAFYHAQRGHPVLTVVFDNKSWYAVERAVREVYPGVELSEYPGADLDVGDIPSTVEKVGGVYIRVERPEEVRPALLRGKEEVSRGRATVVHALVAKT